MDQVERQGEVGDEFGAGDEEEQQDDPGTERERNKTNVSYLLFFYGGGWGPQRCSKFEKKKTPRTFPKRTQGYGGWKVKVDLREGRE